MVPTFASLDVKDTDSREIKRAFDALIQQMGLTEPTSPDELFTMDAQWDGTLTGDDRVDDTLLKALKQLGLFRQFNGPKGAHRYIISNCEPWMW